MKEDVDDDGEVVHQVGFSLHDYIEMHGQQNIKFNFSGLITPNNNWWTAGL